MGNIRLFTDPDLSELSFAVLFDQRHQQIPVSSGAFIAPRRMRLAKYDLGEKTDIPEKAGTLATG